MRKEKALVKEIEKDLDEQIVSAQSILDVFEEKRRQQAEAALREKARQDRLAEERARAEREKQKQMLLEAKRTARGRYLGFFLVEGKHVEE